MTKGRCIHLKPLCTETQPGERHRGHRGLQKPLCTGTQAQRFPSPKPSVIQRLPLPRSPGYPQRGRGVTALLDNSPVFQQPRTLPMTIVLLGAST